METNNLTPHFVERANELLTRIVNLKNASVLHECKVHQAAMLATKKLLTEAAVHIHRIERGAPHFNIFHALGIVRKELVQSKFLAFLLSPTAEHGQKTLFLNTFLKAIGLPFVDLAFSKQVQVQTELSIGAGGRLDIVVKGPGFLVTIENKVDAGEQDEQLPRYRNWLDADIHGIDCKHRELIFLTTSGYDAVTGNGLQYRRMSYLELGSIFESVANLVDDSAVRFSVEQYITACRMVSIGMCAMIKIDPELLALLTSPEHLPIALELQNQMAVIRRDAAETFANIVASLVQTKIANANLATPWVADKPTPESTSIQIRLSNQTDARDSYSVFHSGVVFQGGEPWLGWRWPRSFDYRNPDNIHEAELINQMRKEDGGKTDPGAIWFKYLNSHAGAYDLDSSESMVAVMNDNCDPSHPLAKLIADEIWQVFSKWEDKFTKLPSFKKGNEFNPSDT